MHREHFWGRKCAFVFPIYVRKYRKYTIDRCIVMYTVCFRGDFTIKTVVGKCLKMCHTFKHFIHMQYFLLLTNLVIVFVHWVSTGVLYEPRLCFWDYIPESKLCFCVNLCRPSGTYIFNPTNTEVSQLSYNDTRWVFRHPDGEQPKTALWLWVREMTWYLYSRGVRGRMKAKQHWFKVTQELCHEWFHHVHDGH